MLQISVQEYFVKFNNISNSDMYLLWYCPSRTSTLIVDFWILSLSVQNKENIWDTGSPDKDKGIQPIHNKVEAILDIKAPKTRKAK
jgi:hypothetical protein